MFVGFFFFKEVMTILEQHFKITDVITRKLYEYYQQKLHSTIRQKSYILKKQI